MKTILLTLLMTLTFGAALNAEYPRDAAERFKMKYGIVHPEVEREAKAKAARSQAKLNEKKNAAQPVPSDSASTSTNEEGSKADRNNSH